MTDDTEEARDPGKEGKGTERELGREKDQQREIQEKAGSGWRVRGQRETVGPQDRAPEVGASLGILGTEGSCPASPGKACGRQRRAGATEGCGMGVAGFAVEVCARSHPRVMPKHLIVPGTEGCWDNSENGEAILPASPPDPPSSWRNKT